jgi:subtilisin family serine protease
MTPNTNDHYTTTSTHSTSITKHLGGLSILHLNDNTKDDDGNIIDLNDILSSLGRDGEIAFAVPDGLLFAASSSSSSLSPATEPQQQGRQPSSTHPSPEVLPDDPEFKFQWGFNRTGAPEAWQILADAADSNTPFQEESAKKNPSSSSSNGSNRITICVTDSGIDYTNPDLSPNLHPDIGYNALYIEDGLPPNQPMDDLGHGTHIAGVIGAVGNNSLGVAGLNWSNIDILSCRFLNSDGKGRISDAIICIDYCLEMGAEIITNSWIGNMENKAMKEAIAAAGKQGVLFVSAAGNDGRDLTADPAYPASYASKLPNMIVVASVDYQDKLSTFSNYGADVVHLAAPGEWIISNAPGNTTTYFSGTSMSTPFVAGAAALLLGAVTDDADDDIHNDSDEGISSGSSHRRRPLLSPEQIKHILLETVSKSPDLEGKVMSGGILRIDEALKFVLDNKDALLAASQSD